MAMKQADVSSLRMLRRDLPPGRLHPPRSALGSPSSPACPPRRTDDRRPNEAGPRPSPAASCWCGGPDCPNPGQGPENASLP